MGNIPFQVFAWLSNFAYAFEVVGTKLLSKNEIKNPWLLNFGYSALVLVFTVPLALYYHAGFPVRWTNVILTGVFWAIANICYILVLFKLDVTTLSPLFNLRIAFTVLFSALLLHERLSILQLVFIVMIFLGGILVTLDEQMSWCILKDWKAVLILLAMLLGFTFEAVVIKTAIAQNGYWTVTMWAPVIAQILFCFTLPKFARDVGGLGAKHLWLLLVLGFLDFLGTIALNKAYQENVSISSAIVNIPVSAIMAFALSLASPKLLEKHTVKVYLARFAGIALIVWAGIKLS